MQISFLLLLSLSQSSSMLGGDVILPPRDAYADVEQSLETKLGGPAPQRVQSSTLSQVVTLSARPHPYDTGTFVAIVARLRALEFSRYRRSLAREWSDVRDNAPRLREVLQTRSFTALKYMVMVQPPNDLIALTQLSRELSDKAPKDYELFFVAQRLQATLKPGDRVWAMKRIDGVEKELPARWRRRWLASVGLVYSFSAETNPEIPLKKHDRAIAAWKELVRIDPAYAKENQVTEFLPGYIKWRASQKK